MSELIALVATAVMVDGVRTIIEPGQPLPALSRHDARALTESGAAQAQASAGAAQAAEADFAAASGANVPSAPSASPSPSAKGAPKGAPKPAQNPATAQE